MTERVADAAGWERTPLYAFLAYMVGTFSLCFIGLFSSPGFEPWRVGSFVAVSLAFFAAGYLYVRYPVDRGRAAVHTPPRAAIMYLVAVGISIRLVLALLGLAKGFSAGLLSFHTVLSSPGDIYRFAHSDYFDADALSLLTKLEVLFAPLWYVSLPLAIFYFRRWSRTMRLVVVAAVVLNVLKPFVLRGVQKPIGDLVIIFGAVWILQAALAGWKLRRVMAYVGCLGLLFLAFMAFNQGSRLVAYDAVGFDGGTMFEVNRKHLLFQLLGDRIGESVAVTLSYANIGYFGLSYCFDLPFQWTYGFGNSFALMSYADQYLNVSGLIYETYPLRAEAATGWPSMMYWETIYPWLASDMTYPGVLLFFGLLGWFSATLWKECLCYRNPLSIAALGYVSILLLFVPCNNQLFQTRESTVGCFGVLCVWLLFHRRFNVAPGRAAPPLARLRRNSLPALRTLTGGRTSVGHSPAASFPGYHGVLAPPPQPARGRLGEPRGQAAESPRRRNGGTE